MLMDNIVGFSDGTKSSDGNVSAIQDGRSSLKTKSIDLFTYSNKLKSDNVKNNKELVQVFYFQLCDYSYDEKRHLGFGKFAGYDAGVDKIPKHLRFWKKRTFIHILAVAVNSILRKAQCQFTQNATEGR